MVLKRAFGYLFVNKSDIQSLVFVEQDAWNYSRKSNIQ